jgi:hypothetical protein
VIPNELHAMTRNDILNRNADLIEHTGKLLASLPVYQMAAEIRPKDGGMLSIQVDVQNMDRVDFYLDGRPQRSEAVAPEQHQIAVELPRQSSTSLSLQGYKQGTLVACRHTPLEQLTA